MKNYEWRSDMAILIQNYIHTKQETGLKFVVHTRYLQHFDHFYFYNGYEGTLVTKNILDEFIYVDGESIYSYRNKEIVLNQFTMYLKNIGIINWCFPVKTAIPSCHYIPYIFRKEELQRFFTAIDKYPIIPNSSRNIVDPVLFRFLYGTGVRISEALNLQIEDVKLEDSYVIIRSAKNNKDRLIPLAQSLTERMNNYISDYHKHSDFKTNVFFSTGYQKMDASTAYNHFRDYLVMAEIPHTEQGPRIHSLRHGFAVECLKRWTLEGEDLFHLLPYLSAYMGHTDFRATQYYLRLTAELYPTIVEMTEKYCDCIIPDGNLEYEED